MVNDWLYSDDRMKLREQCLLVLLKKYGGELIPHNTNESIYECAHDWISQGHKTTSGIVKYYEAYYND